MDNHLFKAINYKTIVVVLKQNQKHKKKQSKRNIITTELQPRFNHKPA